MNPSINSISNNSIGGGGGKKKEETARANLKDITNDINSRLVAVHRNNRKTYLSLKQISILYIKIMTEGTQLSSLFPIGLSE